MKEKDEVLVSYKFSLWRRYIVKRFFPNLRINISDVKQINEILKRYSSITLLVWGVTLEEEGINIENENLKILRLEDGFIRSVGLGIRLTPPISLVADPIGIYYNSQKPSYLEYILNNYKFDDNLLLRAKKIIELIRKNRITKYNLNEKNWKPKTTDKKIIVVPGQVESDMSIKYGSPHVKTNIQLLKTVRKNNPDEYIVYKPHPDVINGYRKGNYERSKLLEFCDEVCIHCDTFSLIKHSDEVHTMTSLFGFESLMMGKSVVCYGQPFYSGWGLTKDVYPLHRRKKKTTLYELVAASIILYPMYVSLINGRRISPEEAINELQEIKRNPPLKLKIWYNIQKLLDPFMKLRKF